MTIDEKRLAEIREAASEWGREASEWLDDMRDLLAMLDATRKALKESEAQCSSVLRQCGAAIGVEPGAAMRHVLADRDEVARERDAAERELDTYRYAAILVVGNRFPMRPHEYASRARGEATLAQLLARQMQPSSTPHAHPRDEAAVLAHEARGAVGDEECETQGGPRGDDVG